MAGAAGRVAGKVALITGGAAGLDEASAKLLAAEGAKVAITDINEAGGRAVAEAIGGAARFIRHDVTEEADWIAAIAATVAAFGGLHILVNSAGIGPGKTVEEIDLAEWRRVHAIDLDGVFLGCKHVIRTMAESGGGSIVNISSVAGIIARHDMAAYNSAKAAVRHLGKSVALHCARQRFGVRCYSVLSAFIDTPLLDRLRARFGAGEALAKLGRQVPLGRVGRPDEVAYAILYLASDESSFTTGTDLIVDGGLSAM